MSKLPLPPKMPWLSFEAALTEMLSVEMRATSAEPLPTKANEQATVRPGKRV